MRKIALSLAVAALLASFRRRPGSGPTCLPGRRGDDRVDSPGDGDRTADLSRAGATCTCAGSTPTTRTVPRLNAIVSSIPRLCRTLRARRAIRARWACRAAALHSGDRQGQLRDDRAAERRRLVVAERLRLRAATPSWSSASRTPARSCWPSRTWRSSRSAPTRRVNSLLPGYTRNPYALDRVTAGSSGGTAAAVAANFGADRTGHRHR